MPIRDQNTVRKCERNRNNSQPTIKEQVIVKVEMERSEKQAQNRTTTATQKKNSGSGNAADDVGDSERRGKK